MVKKAVFTMPLGKQSVWLVSFRNRSDYIYY